MSRTYVTTEDAAKEKLREFSYIYGVDMELIASTYDTILSIMDSESKEIFFEGDDWSPAFKIYYTTAMKMYFASLKPSKGAIQTLKYKTRKDKRFISVCEKTGLSLIQHIEKLVSVVSRLHHTIACYKYDADEKISINNSIKSILTV